MVLSTHAAVGAALATFFPTHPEIAFLAAFTSHFLLDSIPHWDYSLTASHKDPDDKMKSTLVFTRHTILDFVKIGADVLLGLLVAYLLFGTDTTGLSLVSILCGVLGGIVPDGLQFLYYRFGGPLLTPLQRFHNWIHAERDLKKRPFTGMALQIMTVAIVTILVYTV